VHQPGSLQEFEQNDRLLQVGRIHAYGPALYDLDSTTALWLKLHLRSICDRIVADRETAMAQRVVRPPVHLSSKREETAKPILLQEELPLEHDAGTDDRSATS
jgi:hypothetical protein